MALRKIIAFYPKNAQIAYFVNAKLFNSEDQLQKAYDKNGNSLPGFITFDLDPSECMSIEGRTPLRTWIRRLLETYEFPELLVGRWETIITNEVAEVEPRVTYEIKGKAPEEDLSPEEEKLVETTEQVTVPESPRQAVKEEVSKVKLPDTKKREPEKPSAVLIEEDEIILGREE